MTQQEEQMLQDLAGRVNQTVVQDKDPEAAQYLQQSLGRNPDALYILAQTVLVQQYGLDQAKKQMDELKSQAAAPPPPPPAQHKSFLGSLMGSHDDAPPPPQQQQYGQPQYAPVPQYAQPQYGQPQYGQPQYGQPQQGGFLQSAMRTAMGVAAGALAFEGIESLFHGFGGGGGQQGFGGFGGGGGGREEVINNYYGDSDRGQDGVSRDIEDRRDFSGSADGDRTSDDAQNDFVDDSSASDSGDSGDSMSDDSSGDFGSSDDNS